MCSNMRDAAQGSTARTMVSNPRRSAPLAGAAVAQLVLLGHGLGASKGREARIAAHGGHERCAGEHRRHKGQAGLALSYAPGKVALVVASSWARMLENSCTVAAWA